jgi:hypothetical protein
MASGFTVLTNEHLIRSNLWSRQLKQLLLDDLYAMQFVRVLTDFPDGTQINIPSLGEAESADFAEGAAIKYNKMDTGNFVFSFDQYKYSANAISEKFKRDSYYSDDVIAAFAPRQHRALMEAVESRILSRGNSGQTASDPNVINEADHRFVATGTSASISLADFAKANYSLTKALVPMTNLCAVVDPSVAYTLQTQANLMNLLTPEPMWSDLVNTGMVTGFKFRFNIFGFDVYVSNYLPRGITETITPSGGSPTTVTTTGVANLFFSAAPGDIKPIIGGFRQMPTVYSEFNKDLQQTEYLTIAEYGFKLFRPENMVVVLTNYAVV